MVKANAGGVDGYGQHAEGCTMFHLKIRPKFIQVPGESVVLVTCGIALKFADSAFGTLKLRISMTLHPYKRPIQWSLWCTFDVCACAIYTDVFFP